MKFTARLFAGALLSTTLAFGTAALAASGYPNKVIQVVLPFATGGPTDTIGRVVTMEMSKIIGQPMVIETRPGASGSVGAAGVARAPADGYTLLMNASVHVIYPGMFKGLTFDPMTDFVPIGVLGTVPMVAVVPANSRFKSFKALVEHSKANPDAISFASPGKATLPHLVGEFVKLQTNSKMLHVSYRGTGPALTDVTGGHVDVFYAPLASALPLIRSGALAPLAVSTKNRIPELPEVPTIGEALSLKEFDVVTWYGLWAPKGTSPEIVKKLNAAMIQASVEPKVAKVLSVQGTTPSNMDVAQTASFVKAENIKWLQIMKDANIQAD